MKKILSRVWENILFLSTLFLLVFIPLYPKLPFVNVRNTWVYVRIEDFLVLTVLIFWFIRLVKRKVTLKTPLTMPILTFWIIGGVATIHGIIFIFPSLANVFPNVAFFTYLRHLEYMSLFFVAYSGVNNKRLLPYVIAALMVTFFAVVLYGLGQRYAGLPAFLTMNEEFAKGIPIQLSALGRVS